MPDAEPRHRSRRTCAIVSPPPCARPARWRCKTFRGTLKSWTKGTILAGQRGRSSPSTRCCANACWPFADVGWLSEETEDDPARLQRAGSGSSIRSTARAPISPACRTGRSPRRWSRPAVRSSPRSMRRSTDELFLAIAGGGATRNGVPIAASDGDRARGRAVRRRQAPARPVSRRSRRASRRCREFPRWRCGSRASRPARSMSPSRPRNSHDWDLAAADLLVHEAGGADDRL